MNFLRNHLTDSFGVPPATVRAARMILAHKTALAVLLLLAPALFPMLFLEHEPPSERYVRCDAVFYMHIAAEGYPSEPTHFDAFYPLWPACIRIGSLLTGGNLIVSGYLLSNLFSLGGFSALHWLLLERHGAALANRAVLLMLCYPGSLFYFLPYTESLFLFLVAVCLLCLHRRAIAGAVVAGFLLPLARPVGIFILPVLLFKGLSERWDKRTLCSLCLPPVAGYLAYFGVMYYFTGTPSAGFIAEKQFAAHGSIAQIFQPGAFFHALLNVEWYHDPASSFIDRAMFGFFVLSLWWIARREPGYFVYSLLMGLVPALSNVFVSYTRYLSVVFPVFVVSGQRTRGAHFGYLMPLLFFGIQVEFLLLYISKRWAG